MARAKSHFKWQLEKQFSGLNSLFVPLRLTVVAVWTQGAILEQGNVVFCLVCIDRDKS